MVKPTDFKPGDLVHYFRIVGRAKYQKLDAVVVKIAKSSVFVKAEGFEHEVRVQPENLQHR